MAILNQGMAFAAAPHEVRRTFVGERAESRLLPSGFELYKFTQYPLFAASGTVTPWWSSVVPLSGEDPGLIKTLERAKTLETSPDQFARARTAVTRQWNRMDGLLRVRLVMPVYAFAGRCSGQLVDQSPKLANVVFIGGAWQLWIPNLSRREVTEVG